MIAAIKQRGTTLIELIVSIVIISVSVVGIMMVITNTTVNSANPMIRAQATAILQAYMDEILAQPIADPSLADPTTDVGVESGETRATYDDVMDYIAINKEAGAKDQSGNNIPGLGEYNVTVDITNSTLNGDNSKRIEIIVTYNGDPDQDGDGEPDVKYRAIAHRVR